MTSLRLGTTSLPSASLGPVNPLPPLTGAPQLLIGTLSLLKIIAIELRHPLAPPRSFGQHILARMLKKFSLNARGLFVQPPMGTKRF